MRAADSYYATSPVPIQNGALFTLLKRIHTEDIWDLTLAKNILAVSSLHVTRSHDCQSICNWLGKIEPTWEEFWITDLGAELGIRGYLCPMATKWKALFLWNFYQLTFSLLLISSTDECFIALYPAPSLNSSIKKSFCSPWLFLWHKKCRLVDTY